MFDTISGLPSCSWQYYCLLCLKPLTRTMGSTWSPTAPVCHRNGLSTFPFPQFLCKTLLLIDSNISLTFQSETIPHLLPITMASQMLRDLSVNLVSPHHHTHTMSHETTSSALFDVRDRGTQFLVCPNGHIHHSLVVVTFLITKDFIWASLLWINVICSLLTLWLTHCDWY